MKILVLFAQHHWTGPADPELQKLLVLKEKGHKITFCFTRRPEGSLRKVVQDYGIDSIENVTLYRKRPSPLSFAKDIKVLSNYCADWKPDVIHCHLSHDHWTGLALRAFYPGTPKPPIVRTIHESRKLVKKTGDSILHSGTEGFIVPTEKFAAKFSDAYGVPSERIQVVGGVVDYEKFRPELDVSKIHTELNAQADAPLIGIVSRIKPKRGHKQLLIAFRAVMDKYPDAKLLIIGRGESMEKLIESNSDLVRAGRVHFLGYRKDDLPNILNALTVKVILGEGSDGTCRAALEAMSCGTAVIAAEIGVLPETVQNGKTGLLVDLNEPKYLEAALDSALENRDAIKKMGAQGRKLILERNTIPIAALKADEFYTRLIKAGG